MLKDLLEDEQISEVSRRKIEEYLTQLEQQILRDHDEHQAEIAILREQVLRRDQEGDQMFSNTSREDLLREINNLNNAIEIYHQETMRRKRVYRHTLEGLLQEINQLHQKLESKETGDIVAKIQEAMEREEEEDLELEGDDFIIDGSSGQVQVLEGRERR